MTKVIQIILDRFPDTLKQISEIRLQPEVAIILALALVALILYITNKQKA